MAIRGQQSIRIGTTREIASSDSGFEVFQRVRNGNGTFRVDANVANTGTGYSLMQVVWLIYPFFQPDDFAINFTSATTFDVVNTTTATTVFGSPDLC